MAEGDEEEEEESYWSELIVELEEIVLSWHIDVFEEVEKVVEKEVEKEAEDVVENDLA